MDEIEAACKAANAHDFIQKLPDGYGTIVGAFAGVLLLSVVDNGLNLMQMNPNAVRGVRGLIILVALIIEAQKFRYTPKSARLKQSPAKDEIPASSS